MFSQTIKRMRNYNEGRADTTITTDLLWCIVTTALAVVLAFFVNQHIVAGGQPLITEFFAGVIHAIMYLQALTLMLLALSYLSDTIKMYRGIIMTVLPIGIYVVAWVIQQPEPVALMYSYGAAISILGIAFYKVSALLRYLFVTVWCPSSIQPNKHRRCTDR